MAESPVQYGRYQLLKKLASGGMAQVWLARQSGMEGFEKLLVIKQVLPWLAGNDEFITMFLDEARLAARLGHPNVVQVFDLGRAEDETLYIAMEYIHGEDLRRLDRASRKQRMPVPIELVVRIVAEAAAGLHYAHSLSSNDGRPLGIVHRDVSPQNILVTFDGGVKVVDFGIAKAADKANKTRAGVLKGKYAYMSPEQASGKSVDHRTDIFALGIMLHELLTGQRLFKREGEILTLHAVVRCEVEPPSRLNPVVPASLDPIVMTALARRPDDRYGTAQLLQRALEEFLVGYGRPASSAHLSDYMRDLFRERLAIEAREGGPAAFLSRRSTTGSTARSVGLGGEARREMGSGREGSGSLDVSLGSMAHRDEDATPSDAPLRRSRRSDAGPGPSRPKRARPEASPEPATRPLGVRGRPIEPTATERSGTTDPELGTASRVVRGMQRRRSLLIVGAGATVVAAGIFLGLRFFGPAPGSAEPPTLSAVAPLETSGAPTQVGPPATKPEPEVPAHATQDSPGVRAPEPAKPVHVSVEALETPPTPSEPAEPPRPERPSAGRLRVSVNPAAARVYLARGERWRRFRGGTLSSGRRRFKIVLPDGAVHLEEAEVTADRTRSVSWVYRTGQLRVLITRPFGMGGRVKVGGKTVGRIPGDPIPLYEGRHTIVVEGDGGSSVTRTLEIHAGKTAKLTVQFD